MNNTIIYTEEGNIILPYKITSSSPFFIKYLKLAKPKDLSIGIHYYQMMPLGKGYLDQVRKKVRKETKEEYAEYVQEEIDKQTRWEETIRFVSKHRGYPTSYPEMDYEEKKLYDKAINLLKRGKLIPEPQIDIKDKKLIEKRFFFVNELSAKQRDRFIHQYGYRHKTFVKLDGKRGNNFIIKNEPKKESDYHFCMKHLIATIDQDKSIIEYCIDDMRADVVFTYNNQKIAIEIETGKNKELQVRNKVKWLNDHFNYWFFLCSRNELKNYKKYVDNKKSFCLTLTQIPKKIQEIKSGNSSK